MTVQLDLFDEARPTAAARTEARSVLRGEVERLLRAHPRGLTDWEIQAALGYPDSRHGSIVKRRDECGAVALVVDGRKVTRQSPLGGTCTVWVLPGEAP